VVCRGERPSGDTRAFVEELRRWVGEQLGAIAKPDEIRFTDNLPKTRSGKIMRRLLRTIASGGAITQDISTLENPGIVDQLRGVEAPAKAAPARRKPPKQKAARKAAKKVARKKTAARKTPEKAGRKATVKSKSGAKLKLKLKAKAKAKVKAKTAAKPKRPAKPARLPASRRRPRKSK